MSKGKSFYGTLLPDLVAACCPYAFVSFQNVQNILLKYGKADHLDMGIRVKLNQKKIQIIKKLAKKKNNLLTICG